MSDAPAGQTFSFAGFSLDPVRRMLFAPNSEPVPLTSRVFDMLLFMVEHPGELLDKKRLMSAVWPNTVVEENNLSQSVSVLRRALGDTRDQHRFIVTISGRGFRFVPTVTRLTAPAGAGPAGAVAIAVLPFVNLSSDREQEYFSDGLTEELINQLARIKALRVAGRTSSFAFKGKNESFQLIGEKLGVNHVLEGSVRRVGQRLRITAQLVKCSDGYHLWSERFDREIADIFAIQEEIALAVASALRVTLGIAETVRSPGGTDNLAAYDKYLRARALFHQTGLDELLRAIEIYREALALDPGFELAWYGLYVALEYAVISPESTAEMRKEMEEQVGAHMMALAPDAWWTQAMRTRRFIRQHRWSEAEAAATAALAAAPASEIDAFTTHATFLMSVGRISEAVASYRRARDADPLSLRVSGFLQLFLDLAGARDEAQTEFERSRDLAGGRARWEWAAALRMSSREDADPVAVEAQFRTFLHHAHRMPGKHLELHSQIADLLNQPAAARALLRRAFEDPGFQDPTLMTIVFLYADHFGDKDLALAALRRSLVDLHKINLEGLWWPFETRLRLDPRFKEIVREIGLVDYWRTSGRWGDFVRPVGERDFEVFR